MPYIAIVVAEKLPGYFVVVKCLAFCWQRLLFAAAAEVGQVVPAEREELDTSLCFASSETILRLIEDAVVPSGNKTGEVVV